MFDELIRELRRLEGKHQVSVPMSADPEGYFDRECPSPECQSQFKVHEDDWRDKVRDEEAFCPSAVMPPIPPSGGRRNRLNMRRSSRSPKCSSALAAR